MFIAPYVTMNFRCVCELDTTQHQVHTSRFAPTETAHSLEIHVLDLLGGAFLGGSQHRLQGRLQRDAAARCGQKLQAMGPPDEGRLLRFAEENIMDGQLSYLSTISMGFKMRALKLEGKTVELQLVCEPPVRQRTRGRTELDGNTG